MKKEDQPKVFVPIKGLNESYLPVIKQKPCLIKLWSFLFFILNCFGLKFFIFYEFYENYQILKTYKPLFDTDERLYIGKEIQNATLCTNFHQYKSKLKILDQQHIFEDKIHISIQVYMVPIIILTFIAWIYYYIKLKVQYGSYFQKIHFFYALFFIQSQQILIDNLQTLILEYKLQENTFHCYKGSDTLVLWEYFMNEEINIFFYIQMVTNAVGILFLTTYPFFLCYIFQEWRFNEGGFMKHLFKIIPVVSYLFSFLLRLLTIYTLKETYLIKENFILFFVLIGDTFCQIVDKILDIKVLQKFQRESKQVKKKKAQKMNLQKYN